VSYFQDTKDFQMPEVGIWSQALIKSAIYIYQGGPKKPLPIFQKIVLKIANEIRFLRKVKA